MTRACAIAWIMIVCAGNRSAHGVPVDVGRLLWADEFDGTSLDVAKWTPSIGGPRRDAVYATEALTVNHGALTIKTYTEGGTHYTGWVDTQNTYQPTYGYVESRIQFNTSHGMWSAFWLQTPDWPDPVLGNPAVSGTEIDVMEHRRVNSNGVDYRSRIHMAVHWDGYGSYHQSRSSTQDKASQGMGNGSWHTYGVHWEPDRYTFYFDDQEVWTHTTAVSQRSEFIILSSEIQNFSWAGTIPTGGYGPLATSTTNMQIDYVRVYSLVPEPSSLAPSLVAALRVLRAFRRRRWVSREHRSTSIVAPLVHHAADWRQNQCKA